MSGGYVHPWPHLGPDGVVTAPPYAFASEPGLGFYRSAGSVMSLAIGGTRFHAWDSSACYLMANDATIVLGAGFDVILARAGAADTLAQRRGVNSQTFRVYNTYTAGANPQEWASLYFAGNNAFLETLAAGGGTQRALYLRGATTYLGSGAATYWQIPAAGHFLANVDNANDIGAEDANRPRNVISNSFQLEALANSGHIQATRLPDIVNIAAAPFTDSAVAIPADAVILAVQAYVVTAIPGPAVTFTVTGSISGMVFNTAPVPVAAGSANAGTMAGHVRSAGEFIRITPNVAPGAATGQVRIMIFYMVSAPPTS
jgi:hypothetical protein